MHKIFGQWNTTELNSYLIESPGLLGFKDVDGLPIVDKILDKAGQRHWKMVQRHSLDLGIPVTLISEAVYARACPPEDERMIASKKLSGPTVCLRG